MLSCRPFIYFFVPKSYVSAGLFSDLKQQYTIGSDSKAVLLTCLVFSAELAEAVQALQQRMLLAMMSRHLHG